MPQGSFGITRVFEDFLGGGQDAWDTGVFSIGNVSVCSVNEGSIAYTVDESGGLVAFTTDTGDNDNVCVFAGAFQPALGGCVMETRFKMNNVTTLSSCFVGFAETLAVATPVMPAEFATATMTYNPGGMVGAQFDIDGTTDAWRACAGDGGVAVAGSGNGTNIGTPVADAFDIVRVEIDATGDCRVYLNGDLKKTYTAALTAADLFHAVLIFENRTAGAMVGEVDYFYAKGGRDWAV